jgi:hypothetical protein
MKLALVAGFALATAGCGSSSSTPAGSGSGKPTPTSPSTSTEPAVTCTTSEDCALVQACCGCNAGGKQIAIRADAVAAFEASRDQRCGGTMCTQMISTDPSCDAEATCGANGRCNVTPHLQHQ